MPVDTQSAICDGHTCTDILPRVHRDRAGGPLGMVQVTVVAVFSDIPMNQLVNLSLPSRTRH